jgi:transcriptional regulator with XRE-family HTH domain
MTIQDRLKQVIKSKKLKITDFANICDIPYRSVQGYLRGERMLGGNAIIKICTQLNINPNWLLIGQGEMHQTKTETKEITTKKITKWLSTWWDEADEEHRHWLNVQMKRQFPEYAEWCEQEDKKDKEN